MFGSKFRTWMEAHIVRAKKKGRKDGQANNGPPILVDHVDVQPPARMVDASCKHSCSSGSGSLVEVMLTQQHLQQQPQSTSSQETAKNGGGASLSSPESAYSTGYSTDGTSPGASFPPEYYINIRTGTHYFHQATNKQQQQQQQQQQQLLQLQQQQKAHLPAVAVRPLPPPRLPPKQVDFLLERSSSPVVPLLKKELPKRVLLPGHRRSESCDVGRSIVIKNPPNVEEPTSLITVPNLALTASPSPRQRSRIRTNPWVPNGTTSSSSSFGKPNGMDDPCSNGFKSGSGSDSTTKKQPIAHLREPKKGILVSSKENCPVVRSPVPSVTWSPRRIAITVSSSSSGSRRSSDDDLTLHEMMGKYDESYVYERETDILSDSDPTDCEDCADTDADTGLDGGDEQDPEDLDFIDKDSFQDLNLADTERGPRRLGHSSYYHFPNELSRKLSRHRECSARRAANAAARRCAKAKSGSKKRRPREANASRSLGGTPVSNRRRPLDNISENRNQHHSPARLAMQRTVYIEDRVDEVKRRSNSVSYVSRSCEVRQSIPGGNYLANFDSEIALIEADKEADRKYKELIMEAEHILVSMKASTPIIGSPRRALNNPPANKRVELLRNAEHDLVPKVRGTDSTPGTPKYCGSPRFSPKKNHITNFIQINSPELSRRDSNSCSNDFVFSSPKKQLLVHSSPMIQRHVIAKPPDLPRPICPASPRISSADNNNIQNPVKIFDNGNSKSLPSAGYPGVLQPNAPLHIDDDSDDDSTEKEQTSLNEKQRNDSIAFQQSIKNLNFLNKNIPPIIDSQSGDSSSLVGTSSSSDGDGELKRMIREKRPPLMSFRSVDIGHRVPDPGYCPQSEPVKRKVYSCSATFDRLQKSLESRHLIRQKSDGEASNGDGKGENQSHLNCNTTKLHTETIDENQNSDMTPEHDNAVQKQITLFKRQMLLQTIEGLKRSLEDQSASLKETYQTSNVKHESDVHSY